MTSKEALENWYNTQSPRTKAYEYELHYRLIKKDLEILEILKSHLHLAIVNSNNYGNKDIVLMIESDDKDFNKVKEWLEDE